MGLKRCTSTKCYCMNEERIDLELDYVQSNFSALVEWWARKRNSIVFSNGTKSRLLSRGTDGCEGCEYLNTYHVVMLALLLHRLEVKI